MSAYTSTARREGRWWIVQCDQYPGALSQVGRLDRAATIHREAIAFVSGAPEDSIELTITPDLGREVTEALGRAEQLRTLAEENERQASALKRETARKLANDGLTVRDIGTILGVSYQRAHQLIVSEGTNSQQRRLAC